MFTFRSLLIAASLFLSIEAFAESWTCHIENAGERRFSELNVTTADGGSIYLHLDETVSPEMSTYNNDCEIMTFDQSFADRIVESHVDIVQPHFEEELIKEYREFYSNKINKAIGGIVVKCTSPLFDDFLSTFRYQEEDKALTKDMLFSSAVIISPEASFYSNGEYLVMDPVHCTQD